MTTPINTAPPVEPGICTLHHLGVIRAVGDDAAGFLNNMLTQDVLLLKPRHARLAALCSVKGRMIATGWMMKLDANELVWVISADILEATLKRLKMFVMRSKLVLSDATPSYQIQGEIRALDPDVTPTESGAIVESAGGQLSLSLPIANGHMRLLHLIPVTSTGDGEVQPRLGEWAWLVAEALAGVGRVSAKTVDAYVPQMLNYESAEGVNFKKGCYPGQEVVARSQFRGTLKRRGFVLTTAATDIPFASGDEVFVSTDHESAVGTVCNAAKASDGRWALIASLQLAAGVTGLQINGVDVAAQPLPYALLDDI